VQASRCPHQYRLPGVAMTADDEIREAARMARFLATGDIKPRYHVRDVLGRGAYTASPTHQGQCRRRPA
jgi:hypothetical protein